MKFRQTKPMLVLVFLLLLSGCISSKLFVINTLANLQDFTRIDDIAYGEHDLNQLSLYLPTQKKAPIATVVFFYGGCWGGCILFEKESYAFVAQALTAHGYAVVIPDYRHYPEVKFAEMIDDTKHAVEWVKTHISEYGGDSHKIFLMGHSAGAHLAAMLTINENYLPPATYHSIKGFIGLAGPYDFLPFTEAYQSVVFGPKENYPASQPINFVKGTEPPLLLLSGQNDETVKPRNTRRLFQKVRQVGGCAETHEYPEMGHADVLGALALPLQNQEPVLTDIIRFLDYYGHNDGRCKPT